MTDMLLVYITCENVYQAKQIGKHLMEKRLCACVNIFPDMQPMFFWLPKSGIIDESKEVVLIAQDLGDFGKDRGEENALETLLKEMCKVQGDYWIRLLYLYPDEITEGVIQIIKENRQICPYLDMPIQHINNAMLKSMRRKTSKLEIIAIIEAAHAASAI